MSEKQKKNIEKKATVHVIMTHCALSAMKSINVTQQFCLKRESIFFFFLRLLYIKSSRCILMEAHYLKESLLFGFASTQLLLCSHKESKHKLKASRKKEGSDSEHTLV